MWTFLFFVMFFGLLASGMPIFLVLGACAAVLFFVSDQKSTPSTPRILCATFMSAGITSPWPNQADFW